MDARIIIVIVGVICLVDISRVKASGVETLEGSFLTWLVNNTDPIYLPVNKSSNEAKITFKFWRREIGSSSPCKNSAASSNICASQTLLPLHFFFGLSASSQSNFFRFVMAQFSCESYPFDSPTINGYSENTLVLRKDYFYKIRYSGCCWNPALHSYGSSTLNQDVVISFISGKLKTYNSPVQLKYIPDVAVAQGEKVTVQLPFYDVDNDVVSCRWADNVAEGGGIFLARFGTLFESNCSLVIDGSLYKPGKYPVAIVLEDFETLQKMVKFHSVNVQFIIEIKGSNFKENPKVNCSFVSSTPAQMPELTANQIPQAPSPGYRPYKVTDACRSYNLLASKDRLITYNDWSSYRCDMPLFGWYRFTDAEGIQMLNSCPVESSSSVNSCGSYYKGWLKNQVLPIQNEGIVNRTVCFSTPGKCNCSYTREIKIINCGAFYAYYLDAVPICNARYCGKEESGIVVYCSSNYIQVDLDISRYNKTMYSSITLRSSSCAATYSSSKISIGTKLGACGTTSRTVGDTIFYENQIMMTGQHSGIISRQLDRSIKVTCMFPNNGYAQNRGHQLSKEVNATEHGFGQFNLYLNMFINKNYAQKHDKFPVFVRLSDRLYFEASTTASSEFLVLIDRCYSTPVEDSNHESKYTFISERCNVDNNVQFHKSSHAKQRFSAKATDLLANNTKAYVHCIVFLCHSSTNDTKCHSGCEGNNMKRTARSVQNLIIRPSTVSKFYLLELGAIEKEKDQSGCKSMENNSKTLILIIMIWLYITV